MTKPAQDDRFLLCSFQSEVIIKQGLGIIPNSWKSTGIDPADPACSIYSPTNQPNENKNTSTE